MSAPPFVLCFSAHDPCGGAGVVADVQTVRDCGARALSVMTAVTVQNFETFDRAESLSADTVRGQFEAVASLPIAAIKIGVVGAHITTVAHCVEQLKQNKKIPLVLDPVVAPTKSDSAEFIRPPQLTLYKELLLPLADVLTPNAAEVCALANVGADADLAAAAQNLLSDSHQCLLITDAPCGAAATRRGIQAHYQKRLPQILYEYEKQPRHFHGGGCRLSSAIAAFMATGNNTAAAAVNAAAYVQSLLTRRRAAASSA